MFSAIEKIESKMTVINGKKYEMFVPKGQIYDKNQKTILIIANCYGVLEYIKELMYEIAEITFLNIFAFNLSGQGKTEGEVSLENFTKDLDWIYKSLKDKYRIENKKLITLVSCSGFFGLTELAIKKDIAKITKKIIIYNLLYSPGPRFKAAVVKMKRFGINCAENPIDMNYDIHLGIKKMNLPIVVIHPSDIAENPQRASKENLGQLGQYNNVQIFTPKNGFNILNKTQGNIIRKTVKQDLLQHLE